MFFLRGISLINVLKNKYLREVQKATWFEAICARLLSNFELRYGTRIVVKHVWKLIIKASKLTLVSILFVTQQHLSCYAVMKHVAIT